MPISRQTLSRWVKAVLAAAGIDNEKYASHSTRMASVSAAAGTRVNLCTIMKAAGWSNDCIFMKFYRRHTAPNFGQMVLDSFLTVK